MPTTPRPASGRTPERGHPTRSTGRCPARVTRVRRAAGWFVLALLLGTTALALSACGSGSPATNVASTSPAVTRQAGAPTEPFRTVSAGGAHSCGLRYDGSIACWGDNTSGKVSGAPGQIDFQVLSAGPGHTCAVQYNGGVFCWGQNEYGQTNVPAGTYTSVSAGGGHTCAVRKDETIACWETTSTARASPLRALSSR